MPEGEDRRKGTQEAFEAIMTENIPKLKSNTKPQIQKSQRMIKQDKCPQFYIIFKLQKVKDKEKNLVKSQRGKNTLSMEE